MPLEIEPSIQRQLSSMAKESLSRLPVSKQAMFVDEYKHKSKSVAMMVVLAIFFPIQLFVLGKTGLGILFLLTAGGLWVWWFIEIFLAARRTRDYNEDVAKGILRDIKLFE